MEWTRSCCLLESDITVTVQYTAESQEVLAGVQALTQNFRAAQATPRRHYTLQAHGEGELYCNERLLHKAELSVDLVPAFEAALYRDWLVDEQMASPKRWILHAAGLAMEKGAWVLCGPSGAGKTTMTLALMQRGAGYVSDEYVCLGTDGLIAGFPRSMTAPLGPMPTDSGCSTVSYRMRDMRRQWQDVRLLLPRQEQIVHGFVPLQGIIYLRYAPGEAAGFRQLGAAEALQKLWPETRNAAPEVFELAMRWVEATPCYALITHSIEGALAHLDELQNTLR